MAKTMRLGAGVLALALSACGAGEADRYLEAIPDAAGLTMEIQGGAAEGALSVAAADPAESATAVATIASVPVAPDDLAVAREKIRALNEAVRSVFARVDEIAASGGEELPGGVKVYGPADRCVEPGPSDTCLAQANLQLRVRLESERVSSFVLLARAVGSEDPADFRPVLSGFLVRGEMARRGNGRLAVNFQNMKAAAGAEFKGEGFMVAGFSSGRFARTLRFRMLGFTRDPAAHEPVTAAFVGLRTPNGTTRVRLAGLADLEQSGPALELGIDRLVYNPDLGGRLYTVVRNWMDRTTDPPTETGDVTSGQYWFARACYLAGGTTPAFKEWFSCPIASGPIACVVDNYGGDWRTAVGTKAAGAEGATWENTCALPAEAVEPPEIAPPTLPPEDSSDDDSPEEGENATGLLPAPQPPVDPVAPDLTPTM